MADMVVHGWDVAVALGEDSKLDPELDTAALDWGRQNLHPEFRGQASGPRSRRRRTHRVRTAGSVLRVGAPLSRGRERSRARLHPAPSHLFGELSPAEVEPLARSARMRRLVRGEHIWDVGLPADEICVVGLGATEGLG